MLEHSVMDYWYPPARVKVALENLAGADYLLDLWRRKKGRGQKSLRDKLYSISPSFTLYKSVVGVSTLLSTSLLLTPSPYFPKRSGSRGSLPEQSLGSASRLALLPGYEPGTVNAKSTQESRRHGATTNPVAGPCQVLPRPGKSLSGTFK